MVIGIAKEKRAKLLLKQPQTRKEINMLLSGMHRRSATTTGDMSGSKADKVVRERWRLYRWERVSDRLVMNCRQRVHLTQFISDGWLGARWFWSSEIRPLAVAGIWCTEGQSPKSQSTAQLPSEGINPVLNTLLFNSPRRRTGTSLADYCSKTATLILCLVDLVICNKISLITRTNCGTKGSGYVWRALWRGDVSALRWSVLSVQLLTFRSRYALSKLIAAGNINE